MKLLIIYFFIVVALANCNSNNNIPLLNNNFFNTFPNEKINKIDTRVVNKFKALFQNQSIQIPLYRYIVTQQYSIFLAIPFNTNIKSLKNFNLNNTYKLDTLESDSLNYVYKSYRNKNEYISIYSELLNNNLVYILTITESKRFSDSLFNKMGLSNRILKS